MEKKNGVRTLHPAKRAEWRKWLESNYTSAEPVLLIVCGKKSKAPNITYDEAVEEALCFGWR